MTELASRLEALLLAVGTPIKFDELGRRMQVGREQLEDTVQELREALKDHGISIATTSEMVELTTSPSCSAWLASAHPSKATALSSAASEVLAIVAYRGPISRFDIEVIRGVDSRQTIRHLVVRGILNRTLRTGAPPVYDISMAVLEHLGITRREDFPRFEELSSNTRITHLLTEQK